ncbi:halocyanin domain-containing protein [Natronomonas sp. CBA1123]|uniref:halocyanin domain-containing protein n=1 Tax=Natronomonas sp. CBA1123 TaxID=2668070 RepID=UPI0012EA101A|nr:halocyanin domain-containing protein [Natronomonas sp. CBA1123]MUV85589.1 halocyanin domain-containing protein [Natronomonas sp. CBA1123]
MTETTTGRPLGRRRFLQTTALAAGGTALVAAHPAAAQADADFEEWFGNVSNYEGIVDMRGAETVSVAVGAEGNGGGFAFEPAAVRVDPGTEVTWEWTGEGGVHNVAAEDGSYESEMVTDAGETFAHAFDGEGVSLYACTPHKAMGMKAAIVAGDIDVGASTAAPDYVPQEPEYDGWFDGVDNFEGTVDMRGREEVRIAVDTDDSGAPVFSPPAVHVDPGTRVLWEWSGDTAHAVAAADGSYTGPEQSSGMWGLAFDGTGISKYACSFHGDGGMRGAVVVGNIFEGVRELTVEQVSLLGVYGAALLSPLALGVLMWVRSWYGAAEETETLPSRAPPNSGV